IVNVAGRRVLTRPLGRLDAGRHTVSWDTEDAQGARVAPGVYFVTLRTTAGSATRRVTVLR
ncbi:MAG: hypothetical protein KC591_17130, partial [Gemmatimonadetes bacterium]|nr:hypothetical protein [Gemmatimonadota bacterium]